MEVIQDKKTPFLKWPGGKRWLVDQLIPIIKKELKGTYYEPFIGGGAVFFGLNPDKAIISDINDDLITTYKVVKKNHKELIKILKRYPVEKDFFYRLREREEKEDLLIAARFLYLNRTGFSGMYRVNKEGRFNVPYGGGKRTPEILWKKDLLKESSEALNQVKVLTQDFESIIKNTVKGDVIYCDPTYTVTHNNNGFVSYNENNFSWKDQIRLANIILKKVEEGVVVLLSNAAHDSIYELYQPFKPIILNRKSLLSPKAEFRRDVSEALFILKGKS